MKRFLCILVLAVLSLSGYAQRYYSGSYYRYRYYTPKYHTYNYSYGGSTPSLFSGDRDFEPGSRFSWPMDCAFSLGKAFVNTETPEYGGGYLNKDYFVIGAKICGFTIGFGDNTLYTNESVYGYSKTVNAYYIRYGLELGRIYFTTKNGKVHSFSLAPTYTHIWYGITDGSGNNIGWTNWDYQKRQDFYEKYPDTTDGYLGGWGVTFNYNYEYFGVDISVSEKVVEISLLVQLDFNPWIHNLIRR